MPPRSSSLADTVNGDGTAPPPRKVPHTGAAQLAIVSRETRSGDHLASTHGPLRLLAPIHGRNQLPIVSRETRSAGTWRPHPVASSPASVRPPANVWPSRTEARSLASASLPGQPPPVILSSSLSGPPAPHGSTLSEPPSTFEAASSAPVLCVLPIPPGDLRPAHVLPIPLGESNAPPEERRRHPGPPRLDPRRPNLHANLHDQVGARLAPSSPTHPWARTQAPPLRPLRPPAVPRRALHRSHDDR